MGKRKKSSRKPTGPKKRDPLPTNFRCVFCNHETSVSVKIDKKVGIGSLSCKSCGQSFQAGITNLTQPIDVYSDWVDACEDVSKDRGNAGGLPPPSQRQHHANASARAGLAPGEKYTDEDAGFIDDDGVDPDEEFGEEV